MRFTRWVFAIAGLYGLLAIVPLYFLEQRMSPDNPLPINHPEYYYGFAGVALAWQILFLLIAWDPQRLRPVIPVAVIEKLSFAIAIPILYLEGRVGMSMLAASIIDAILALLFAVALFRTRRRRGDALLYDMR